MTPLARRADFGLMGSEAYPGALSRSWGAVLVEPASIARLRERAGHRLVRLGDLAPPRYGIKPGAVKFFCVQEVTEVTALRAAGIGTNRDAQRLALVRDGNDVLHVMERKALRPLIRRPELLEGRVEADVAAADGWYLFYVHATRDELIEQRLPHAVSYIDYGASEDFQGPEGGRRVGGRPAARVANAARSNWYSVPRADDRDGRVCWVMGRGLKHYVPTLRDGVMVPNNFYYSVPPDDTAHPLALGAVANLSFTHLMVEINGRRSGGDGVLHTYGRELARLPLVDPRLLTQPEVEDLIAAYEPISRRQIHHIDEELRQPDRQRLDAWAMNYLFADDAPAAQLAVERALRDLARERQGRQPAGRVAATRAQRRRTFDASAIAHAVADHLGPPPSILAAIAAELQPDQVDTRVVSVPPHPEATSVERGETMFDQSEVLLNGATLLSAPTPGHAALLVAALRLDRTLEGDLSLPESEAVAMAFHDRWLAEFRAWAAAARARVHVLLPEANRQSRRFAVLNALERQTGLIPQCLTLEQESS